MHVNLELMAINLSFHRKVDRSSNLSGLGQPADSDVEGEGEETRAAVNWGNQLTAMMKVKGKRHFTPSSSVRRDLGNGTTTIRVVEMGAAGGICTMGQPHV
jgi:hypothetical protein